jgi:hypothetical protein
MEQCFLFKIYYLLHGSGYLFINKLSSEEVNYISVWSFSKLEHLMYIELFCRFSMFILDDYLIFYEIYNRA